jgi:hypothetical protein
MAMHQIDWMHDLGGVAPGGDRHGDLPEGRPSWGCDGEFGRGMGSRKMDQVLPQYHEREYN